MRTLLTCKMFLNTFVIAQVLKIVFAEIYWGFWEWEVLTFEVGPFILSVRLLSGLSRLSGFVLV